MASTRQSLEDFLRPLTIDVPKIRSLARSLGDTFTKLASESEDQFLSTPISDSVLRPEGDVKGRYLAIDIGGTNLRVGFIELLGPPETAVIDQYVNGDSAGAESDLNGRSRVQRHLEKAWPIGEQLKNNKAEDLFAWIGKCIAEVVRDGCRVWGKEVPEELPLGITFSFPINQHTLSDATLMSMGKGFAITANLDLSKLLREGYDENRDPTLPRIKIAAIVNDAVATLVSFAYQFRTNPRRKAAMGLIVGTGCNATIPLALSKLHPNKRPSQVKVVDDKEASEDLKITVNTEWTIKGAAGPLHNLNFITRWDETLDSEGEAPGFQPFEYMTAGRYLGELGRLIILDYFTNNLLVPISTLPPKLLQRHGLTTTFLGKVGPQSSHITPSMLQQLELELPLSDKEDAWHWTEETADVVFRISKAIEVRAAGMTAAAVIGLLSCADEICFNSSSSQPNGISSHQENGNEIEELLVGYTGGCIVHFQDYLQDCQHFLDEIMDAEFSPSTSNKVPRVVLSPCHDGGIIGAGILAGTVVGIARDVER